MFQNITQIVKASYYLMIQNGVGWHHLAVKKLLALLRGVKKNKTKKTKTKKQKMVIFSV